MNRGTVVLALCLAATSLIAAATQIRDTAYTGFGGQLFTGRITISAPQMTTQDGCTVLRWEQTYTVTNGVIALDLEPNDTATPPGTQYVVVYHPRLGPAWSERWSVATISTGSLRINQVRMPEPPPPKITPYGTASRYRDGEVPTGTLNGTNRTFILAVAPDPPASLILIRNGLVQRAGLDYTLTARTIEFVLGGIPQADDLLQAWYRF